MNVKKNLMIKSKLAQAWGFDLVVGLLIFLSGILFFYFYSINSSGGNEQELLRLRNEAKLVSGNLMSEGYPLDWDNSNVKVIGIYDGGKINQTKLERFESLANHPVEYMRTRSLFNINDNYYVNFPSGVTIGTDTVYEIGNSETENAKNIVKVSRAVIYNNEIYTMEVYVWN